MDENKKITIVTHNGNFHADEILAIATLLLFLGENEEVSIIRSREQQFFDSGDYVVDVGEYTILIKTVLTIIKREVLEYVRTLFHMPHLDWFGKNMVKNCLEIV